MFGFPEFYTKGINSVASSVWPVASYLEHVCPSYCSLHIREGIRSPPLLSGPHARLVQVQQSV